jgi:hypothetical protein
MKSVADSLVSYPFSFWLEVIHPDSGGLGRNPHTPAELCESAELEVWDSLEKAYTSRMQPESLADPPVLVEFT